MVPKAKKREASMLTFTVPQPHEDETSLYYVSHTDARGDDMSSIVEAQTPSEAVLMWQQSYDFLSRERPDIVFQIPSLTGIRHIREWRDMVRWTGARF